MIVDNRTLVQDLLTLTVIIAQAPPTALIVAPGSASDAVFCIRSLRSSKEISYMYGTPMQLLKSKAVKFWFYHSWRAYSAARSVRPGARSPVCAGCGKRISRHRP